MLERFARPEEVIGERFGGRAKWAGSRVSVRPSLGNFGRCCVVGRATNALALSGFSAASSARSALGCCVLRNRPLVAFWRRLGHDTE